MNPTLRDKREERQRNALIKQHGQPVLELDFSIFANGKVSMWAHTRHHAGYWPTHEAFVAVREHLRGVVESLRHLEGFIEDGYMCPFHPDFKGEEAVQESPETQKGGD